jgi:ArsR family transcriptional regulator
MEFVLAGLRAAAESTRLRMLALCAEGELTVGELTQILGQSQPRVSRHLKLLCEAGLLDRTREGASIFYRVAHEGNGAFMAKSLTSLIPHGDSSLALDFERLEAVRKARRETAARYFDSNAAGWDRIRALHVDEKEVEQALTRLFDGLTIESLLDIGTGTGRVLELFAHSVARALGVDLSREMLAVARASLERANLRNCAVRKADMYQLPIPSNSHDAVTIHQVLHFADDPGAVIAEAARVLDEDGKLVIVDFARHQLEYLRTEHAHRRLGFSDRQITEWCSAAGLRIGEAVHLPGDPLTVGLWPTTKPAATVDLAHVVPMSQTGAGR